MIRNRFKVEITFNLVLALIFLGSNFQIWERFNDQTYIVGSIHFDPLMIQLSQRMAYTAGNWLPLNTIVTEPNFPFWLFFVAIAVNLYFIFRLQRSIETKQIPS